MAKYKATLTGWYFGKKKADSAKLKAGTPQISVFWKAHHSEGHGGVWVPMTDEAANSLKLSKTYYLGNDEITIGQTGVKKTRTVFAKECMEKEFDLPMNAPSPDGAIGFENELVTEINGEYENVKFVNNPNKKSRVMKDEDKGDFASIWGTPAPKKQEPLISSLQEPPPVQEEELPF